LALGFSEHAGMGDKLAATSLATAEQDELQRHFAREVHDQLAQPLIALVLEMHELRTTITPPAEVNKQLARLEEAARAILRQAREMMVDLRHRGELRINLPQALRSEVAIPVGRDVKVNVTSRWPTRVNGWAAFNLLRIVQQAVANAWRHGQASKVEIVLDVGPADEAVLVVIDDGVGIEDAPYGFGMAGMRERAAILGGGFNAQPLKSRGTRVEVRVPLGRLT